MSAFDDYKKKLLAQGNNESDFILNNTKNNFEELFDESPTHYTVTVNGNPVSVRILSPTGTTNANKRAILFNIGDIEIGDIVIHDNQNWLVMDLPYSNRIYEKSIMALCTQVLTIKGEPTRTQIGTNPSTGEPVYDYVDGTVYNLPCVVKSIKETYTEIGDQINLPDGRIVLYIPYTNNSEIKKNKTFEMFNDTYIIYGVDYSKVIGTKGYLIITADKK